MTICEFGSSDHRSVDKPSSFFTCKLPVRLKFNDVDMFETWTVIAGSLTIHVTLSKDSLLILMVK